MKMIDLENAMREVERKIKDERVGQWVDLMLKGWKNKDIAEKLGFKHPTQFTRYRKDHWYPVMKPILEKHLRRAM